MKKFVLLLLGVSGVAQSHEFVFTITADSHLDDRTDGAYYASTLTAAATDKPLFHVDLGDTFMSEKLTTRAAAAQQYVDQRRYFDLLGVPVHLVQGNHDGESGRYFDGTTNNLALWSQAMRQRYFPDPLVENGKNYYSWQQDNALFVVLDPYGFTPRQRRQDDNWTRTIGINQYQWLKKTLEESDARFKFVFIHQLVGGLGQAGRGGIEAAPFFEWGGQNPDGEDVFHDKRPGWAMPLHALFVTNQVSIVFHGHDHLFAKQELDGLVYQEVPQPGDSHANSRGGEEYGYQQGVILPSSGYLRLTVSDTEVKVDYVHPDRTVAYSYRLSP